MSYTRKHKTKICKFTGNDPKKIYAISMTELFEKYDYTLDDVLFIAYTDYETWGKNNPIHYIFTLDKLDYTIINMMCPGKEILNDMFKAVGVCTNREFNRYLAMKVYENAVKRGYKSNLK